MWLKELKTHANPDIKIFLIGNKIDLIKTEENIPITVTLNKQMQKINFMV